MEIVDDSKKIIDYYTRYYKNHKDPSKLTLIVKLMNEWSEIVRTSKFTESQLELFESALFHSDEKIWYTAGPRLAKFYNKDKRVAEIFDNGIKAKKVQARVNSLFFSSCFGKDIDEKYLLMALEDKSIRVRRAAASKVLLSQNKEYLEILKQKLKTEDNAKVIEDYMLTIQMFDKVKIDKRGNRTIEM